MKRILVTESQYSKLVKLLNEQFIKFNNPEDEKDVSHDILDALTHLTGFFAMNKITKDVYVDKIEHGVVYLDSTKYSNEEREQIEKIVEDYVDFKINPRDKVLPNVFGFDSGIDSDWVSGDIAVVDNENSDVAEVEDDSDVAVIEDEDDKIYKSVESCNFGKNSEGKRRKVLLPPAMDIKFYQDILKRLNTKVTCEKIMFFFAWRSGEASKSTYNPFATTYGDEKNEGCYYNCLKNGVGYSPTGCRTCPSGSSPGVRNYKTYESGLNATVKTLTNGRYPNVVTKLKNNDITAISIASEVSELKTWGTGGLVIQILNYNDTLKPKHIEKYEGDSIVDDDCVLTSTEYKFYKEHIKSKNDGNSFRKWVNSDNSRLNFVNRKLADCGIYDGLSESGELNQNLELSFKFKGKEWVSEGKPGLSKDEDSGSLTFLPPNKKGWNIRGTDCYGSGSYGSSRGNRSHKGVDIKSDEGDTIVSPIDGYISKTGYKIYKDKCSYLVGVDVKGTGKYSDYKVRLFYVKGNLPTDTIVKKGDPIGVQQSLQKNCYPKTTNGKYCMTNHVHVELFVNGIKKDPTTYNWGKSSSVVDRPDEVKKLPKEVEEIGQPEKGKSITKPTGAASTSLPKKLRCIKGKCAPHHGYDIVGPYGGNKCLIVSNKPGIVTYAGVCGSYGNFIEIKHNDGTYSSYGHLHKKYLTSGQKVAVGDVIGTEGSTGHVTGRHLHFEVRVARPKGLKNRCGEGSPYNEVYGYGVVKPVSTLNDYFYYQQGL